jgi:hypothetical protein
VRSKEKRNSVNNAPLSAEDAAAIALLLLLERQEGAGPAGGISYVPLKLRMQPLEDEATDESGEDD